MFENVPQNPPDAIFGLIEQFKQDAHPEKINLSVGVYQDDQGRTPVMRAVHEAEAKLLAGEGTKSYLPIDGLPGYREAIARLMLGDQLIGREDVHSVTAQTPGGTAALRVAGEFLCRVLQVDTIWMSNPTWANHQNIFEAAGLNTAAYDYLDESGTGLDLDRLLTSIGQASPGQAVLLHAVCHNPTGVDPTAAQWEKILATIEQRQLVPVFDFAYQGFGDSLDEDAQPLRQFISRGGHSIICNSFSKNFGLYGERVGGITAVAETAESAAAVQSQFKRIIRMMYSNPPLHGASIVSTVLQDPGLREIWVQELTAVRQRIKDLRRGFVDAMKVRLPDHDFDYINRQRGMFSYSGLNRDQVDRLRTDHSIYALGSGRINVAGINQSNLDRLCDAIADVVGVGV